MTALTRNEQVSPKKALADWADGCLDGAVGGSRGGIFARETEVDFPIPLGVFEKEIRRIAVRQSYPWPNYPVALTNKKLMM